MKKILSIIICAVFIAYILTACCEEPAIEKIAPTDTRYTPAYERVETEFVYRYNLFTDEFVLVPDTHTVHYDEKYEVKYNITYSNGSTNSEWREVDKDTYEDVKDTLPP
jgi:hypothetical protein